MTTPPQAAGGSSTDGCADLRAEVRSRCAESREAATANEAAVGRMRDLRRDVVAAEHAHEEATSAADPSLRAAEKSAARDAYQLARSTAASEEARREATATWAKAVDHINRTDSLAKRAVLNAAATLEAFGARLREAEREEQALRLRADQAESACLAARVRLASCEEGTSAPTGARSATASEPHAATAGHAVAIGEGGAGAPLVIESMVSGDRVALELAAMRIAERTGNPQPEVQLLLQELVDVIVSAAAEDGHLVFDQAYSFWAGLTFEEARDVIAALGRLGFVFEPMEGWHAGRAPAPSDLSMALAYAGLDARNMRGLPTADELARLPGSIGVDARSYLAATAPELAIDNVVRMLGRRASSLEPLWNEWGQVRPVLLSDRHSLGTLHG